MEKVTDAQIGDIVGGYGSIFNASAKADRLGAAVGAPASDAAQRECRQWQGLELNIG